MLRVVIEEKGRVYKEMRRRTLLLLSTMALVLVLAGGTAMAESQNGPIYYGSNLNILNSVDPNTTNPQPTRISPYGEYFDKFDVSPDRKTLVYERGCGSPCASDPLGPLFTIRRESPYDDFSRGVPTEVDITNLWACDPTSTDPNLNCSGQQMTMPRFSPDGKTIYFIGQRILASDDSTRGIYSIPTEGGGATRIPIENTDGIPQGIGTFALSHDGSTFAFSHKPADGNVGIFSVPVGGGVPRRITDQGCRLSAASPSFSPDDRMIVFTSRIYSGDNCTGTGHQTIYTTPTNNDGTSPGTPLFPEDATDTRSLYKYSPTYSPDGKYIAFGNSLSNVWRLATAPATGGNVTVIDDAPCVGCDPLWLEQPLDTTIASVTMEPGEGSIKTTFGFSSNDDEATFECKLDDGNFEPCTSPKEYPGLLEGSSHTFEVRAVDSAGNTDPTPARRTWTVDTTPPRVVGVSPAGEATGVALGTNVEVTFSEDMDAITVFTNFTLTKQGSLSPVPWSSMGYSLNTDTATLDPASNLEANTTYTATVKGDSTGAKDLAGNVLEQDYSWTFTTAATCTKTGTANAETITGTSGADVICAGGGNDTIKGLGGNDVLKGEAGNDTLLGGVGNDTLDGGLGTDTASYSASLTAVIASLATNAATGEGSDTFLGVENLLGSSKADTLTGSTTNNKLTGGGGTDAEYGGMGSDTVIGSGGADTLKGEGGNDSVNSKDGISGNDSLYGGTGTDTKVTDATEKSIVGFP
jgi:hypothetical protein